MGDDTITVDYTISPSTYIISTPTTSGITGANASNIWTDDISAKASIKYDAASIKCDGTLEVQGRDVLSELDEMRDALMLIKRDVDMEAKYPKLKELKDEYAKQLAKYATFDAIKDSKLTYTDGDNT